MVKQRKPKMFSEIPEDLKNVPYVDLKDKGVRVYMNSRVLRLYDEGFDEPKVGLSGGRAGNKKMQYPTITVNYGEKGNRKQAHHTIHRLVAEAFIPNPENKIEVNHIDGNKSNNDLENLEWSTRQENAQHMYDTGLVDTLETTKLKCARCCVTPVVRAKVCPSCYWEEKALIRKLKNLQSKRKNLKGINLKLLKDRYRKIGQSRYRGLTLEEISEGFGVTRERIRQQLAEITTENSKVYKHVKPTEETKDVELKISLKAARVNADLKVNDVAKVLGVTPATVTNWERGRSKIPSSGFDGMVMLYKIPIDNLKVVTDNSWYKIIA